MELVFGQVVYSSESIYSFSHTALILAMTASK